MKRISRGISVFLCVILLLQLLCPMASAAYSPNKTKFSASYQKSKYYTQLMAYKLTGNGAKDIVAIARTQLGYHESNKASDLGGTSSGTKNYTEYGRWFMDGKTSCTKGPWCAKFVSWCAYMAGIGADKIRMSKAAAAGDFKGSNTDVYSWKDVKDGRVVPQEGDLIIFRGSSAEKLSASSSTLLNHGTHVELACSYQTNPKNKNQGLLTTIGGNTSDRVKEHSNMTVSKKTGYCSVMGMYVYAIVRPRYCSHVWDAAGVCTKAGCSAQYDWKATGKTSAAGIYGVTTDLRLDEPLYGVSQHSEGPSGQGGAPDSYPQCDQCAGKALV